MSLVKCKECGAQISKSAAACPQCGAKQRRTSVITWIVTPFALLWLVGYLVATSYQSTSSSNQLALASAPAAPIQFHWVYRTEPSKMAKGDGLFAAITSSNQLTLASPYAGAQRATVTLRYLPEDGHNALIQIERGQFVCGYPSCPIKIRLDDKPAQIFQGRKPSDYSSTTLFIEPYPRLSQLLAGAKIMRIETPIYQSGSPVLEFDVSGFDPKRIAPVQKR